MAKSSRPKSKEEKLKERQKHFLDEKSHEDLFLDEGASESEENLSDDSDVPMEASSKNPIVLDFQRENNQQATKKRKKKKVQKIDDGIFKVETGSSSLHLVSLNPATLMKKSLPATNFKEELLRESSKRGRKRINNRWNPSHVKIKRKKGKAA
uniref:Uncharacterized protein n=1 Tax=Acrobeloides nanus TaxID=290746 RepID=A0A914BYM7_9BILA